MSISSQLLILNETKNNIKTAINLKGVSVTNEPFAEYPDKVRLIPNGGGIYDSTIIAYLEGSIKNADIPLGTTAIEQYAFGNCPKLKSVSIPNTVTYIGTRAFWDCPITTLSIPGSVLTIGSGAFTGTGITSLTLGNGITTIGEHAFYNCSGLTSVVIPDSVTSIGAAAFQICYHLSSVTIGTGVTQIGDYAFQSGNIEEIVCLAVSPPTIGNTVFGEFYSVYKIYVPDDSVLAYQTADGWMNYASKIKGISEKPQ